MTLTVELNLKQAKCQHDWNIDTLCCKKCGITKEKWEAIADTKAVKFYQRKGK